MSEIERGDDSDFPVAAPGLRILVVDDNRDSAESLALMLQMIGHDARSATDGLTGLETAQAFRPEVMFLDIAMPRLNGYDVARRIRSQQWGRELSLIAMTGMARAEDEREALEAGFNHHLVKPVEFESVMELLRRPACAGQ
jgi:CheY-like chemotaxis protein